MSHFDVREEGFRADFDVRAAGTNEFEEMEVHRSIMSVGPFRARQDLDAWFQKFTLCCSLKGPGEHVEVGNPCVTTCDIAFSSCDFASETAPEHAAEDILSAVRGKEAAGIMARFLKRHPEADLRFVGK